MWEEAAYVLASLLVAYILSLLVIGGKGAPCMGAGSWWRRWRVAAQVWAARAGADSITVSCIRSGITLESTPAEKELEQHKPFVTDRHEDEVSVSGVDLQGGALVLRVARLSQRRAAVFLSITDHSGTVYTLPNQPDTSQVNVDGDGWRGAGLSVTCVDPMKCWRLKFNGILRRGTREEYVTEGESTEEEGHEELVHARVDLLWRAVRRPVDVWAEVSPALLARALAHHPFASPKHYLAEESEGYEQWGCLHGTVRLHPEAVPEEWYLRGPRRHRWGVGRTVGRGLSTCVYYKNGDMFSLRAHSSSSSSPQYISGYLYKASGHMYPVTWCDLDLNHLEKLDQLGHNLLIKFKAGGAMYETWQRLGRAVRYCTGDPWTSEHHAHTVSAASTHSHGRGITTLSSRYTALCPVPEKESLPTVEVPPSVLGDAAPLVVTLEDPCCRDPNLVGGKGASLALLMAYKELLDPDQELYEVPPGVVVTSRAWQVQLASCPDLQQTLRAVRLAAISGQAATLKEACARAVEVCSGAEVCEEVANALMSCLEDVTNPESVRLAVRSSGCAEDGQEASAAGQNQTVLGVTGRRAVLGALATCWASLFSYHSVEYRRQRGQAVEAGMGVVVQELVAARAAGVVFTVDPANGRPDTITITANYGLGESVVSATAEPDTLVVRRSWRDVLTLHSSALGRKATMCVPREEGGTHEVAVGEEEQRQACISDEAALKVARVALYLHNAFAGPRDIEFALLKEEAAVVVLQARPITTLEAWTEYELVHEQDTALLTDEEPLTKANIGEVLPGSISPLVLSIMPGLLDRVFQEGNLSSDMLCPYHTLLCQPIGTHIFINMVETLYRVIEAENSSVALKAMHQAVFGHDFPSELFQNQARERFGVANAWKRAETILVLLHDAFKTRKSVLKSYQDKYWEFFEMSHGRAESASHLFAEITRRHADLFEVIKFHVITSKVASAVQCIAFVLLAEENKEISHDNVLDMSLLLSCAGTETADVPNALKELSRVIGANEEAEEFQAMTEDEATVWLQSHPGPVGASFREFLAKHGHRAFKELDLHSLSWRLDPHSLVRTLQVMARTPAKDAPAPSTPPAIDHLLDQLKTPISHNTRRSLKFLLPRCRSTVVQREAAKSLFIKALDGLRSAYRQLATLLVSEGRLPDPELVFFLKHAELRHLVGAPSPALLAKAVVRRRLRQQLEDLKFPEISVGMPEPEKKDEDGAAREGGSVVLYGSPVCHGRVTAPARVITRLQDAETIQNGDILVTVSTDIGWSPYFPLLAGVVTELGGHISHGAVVAREYGLPCLVGVDGATRTLCSGDRVVLDSASGTLTLLSPSPPPPPPASPPRSPSPSPSP